MKMHETIKKLRHYNKWRRGDEELSQPDPREIGIWIDEICNYAEENDDRDDARRLADAVAEKAKALVARWDQPSWKDVAPTAGFIYDLRNAVAAYEAVKK